MRLAIEQAVRVVGNLLEVAQRDDKTPLQNALALSAKLANINEAGGGHVVVFGDINGFKAVNTSVGYDGGDAAINRVGKLLGEVLEPFAAAAYRQSGDEFVVVCREPDIVDVADALQRSFSRVFVTFAGNRFHVSMSFGYAVADEEASPAIWRKRAEDACKVAKQRGPGSVVPWSADIDTNTEDHRCRCEHCGCAFTATLPTGTVADPSVLHCPKCGSRRSEQAAIPATRPSPQKVE